jgi:hypothetical protein
MADAPMPTPTIPNIPRPVATNKANTVLNIGGYAARMSSFSITQGNDVKYRNLTNREDVTIVDRTMAGNASVELPLIAEKDFLGAAGIITLGTPGALTVTHGTAAGNIVTCPACSCSSPSPRWKTAC